MAAIAFDTLKYARRLIEAGVPEQQAQAQAEGMAEAFLVNIDALVTRDYLDARLAEQDARIETRFGVTNSRIAGLEQTIEGQFRLVYWMLAVITASTVIPALHKFLT